jgi:hypothetical protein
MKENQKMNTITLHTLSEPGQATGRTYIFVGSTLVTSCASQEEAQEFLNKLS